MCKKGFTLIEMLVALAISGIILVVAFSLLGLSLNASEGLIRQTNKQEALLMISESLDYAQNATNVVADYNQKMLWIQMPNKQNDQLIEPFCNGEWYTFFCDNNQLKRIKYSDSKTVVLSPSDVIINNAVFDFDKYHHQIRVTFDMWHVKDNQSETSPLKSTLVIYLLNSLETFDQEVSP